MVDKVEEKERVAKIFRVLLKMYPDAKIALKYGNEWELLVATELSAQCTDKKVNEVTAALFKKYRSIQDYAGVAREVFETDIRPTGFYRNKAKNIIAAAQLVLTDFGGRLPRTMEEMLRIPGVARKTANIILGNAFGVVEGIAVDTHVFRLSHRLGLSGGKTPEKVETDLMRLLPKPDWFGSTYLLIEHGRNICGAKKARCDICDISGLCPSAFKV
jgi:endonuclease III